MYTVREDDLSGQQTRDLLALHLNGMNASSPPGSAFALDLSGLRLHQVTVWTAWCGDRLAAIGALKMLGERHAEVKSMRTDPDFLRKGAGSVILNRIIETAKARGVDCLSLETGGGDAFEPALALYRRRGFVNGAPFSDYVQSKFNQFLHLQL